MKTLHSETDTSLSLGWPEGVPLPTQEEVEKTVQEIEKEVRESLEELRKKNRPPICPFDSCPFYSPCI